MALTNFRCIVYGNMSELTSLIFIYSCSTYHVAHRLEFHTTRHATGGARLLDLRLICLREVPDRVAWVAEHPKVVPADVAHLLQVCLVDSRPVQLLDERVRFNRCPGSLAGRGRASEEKRLEEGEKRLMRAGEGDEGARRS